MSEIKIQPIETSEVPALKIGGEYAVMVATAKQYPRPQGWQNQIIDYLTSNEDRALECLYAKPKSDGSYTREQLKQFSQLSKTEVKTRKLIVGASAFFARNIASVCDHLLVESIILEENEKNVKAQARAWDMQTNKISIKQWTENIWGQAGRYSQSQIETIKQSAQMKAYRSVVMDIIPQYIWEPVLDAVKKYLAPAPVVTNNKVDYSKDKFVSNAINFIKEAGGTELNILNYLEIDTLESMTSEQALSLRTMARQIHNKEITVAQAFGTEKPAVTITPKRNN
jgi:hypothetical protein